MYRTLIAFSELLSVYFAEKIVNSDSTFNTVTIVFIVISGLLLIVAIILVIVVIRQQAIMKRT